MGLDLETSGLASPVGKMFYMDFNYQQDTLYNLLNERKAMRLAKDVGWKDRLREINNQIHECGLRTEKT